MSLTSLGAGLIPAPVPVPPLAPAVVLAPQRVPVVTSNEALKRFGWSMPELFEDPKTITVYKPQTLGPTTLLLPEAFRRVALDLARAAICVDSEWGQVMPGLVRAKPWRAVDHDEALRELLVYGSATIALPTPRRSTGRSRA